MVVHIKAGGAWRTGSDGLTRIRAGGVWQTASFINIKSGGVWRDSGYRGYPNAPSNPRVLNWDNTNFSWCICVWDAAPAGGAPIDHYQVLVTDTGGNAIGGYPQNVSAGTTQHQFNTVPDGRYIFYVRSVTAAGLVNPSGYVSGPYARPAMGHTALGHNVSQLQQRNWSGATGFQSGLHRNWTALVGVPNSVTMTSWHLNASLNFGGAYISGVVGPNNRQVYFVYANAMVGAPGSGYPWNTPSFDVDLPGPGGRGQDSTWGIITDGIGWSDDAHSTQLLLGAIYIYGIEDYYVDVWVVDRNAAGNGYW